MNDLKEEVNSERTLSLEERRKVEKNVNKSYHYHWAFTLSISSSLWLRPSILFLLSLFAQQLKLEGMEKSIMIAKDQEATYLEEG